MLCVDMVVPKEHLLRKVDKAVDFNRIYELVEELYCEDNARPSSDPVVLFKLVFIQHLFGIRSLRQTLRDAEVNAAYSTLVNRFLISSTQSSAAHSLVDEIREICPLVSNRLMLPIIQAAHAQARKTSGQVRIVDKATHQNRSSILSR